MKKHIIISAMFAAAALCSCVKEELVPAERPENAVSIVFEGEFNTATKIQFGDAQDGIYSLSWSAGDAIGIFSYDQKETQNNNIQAILHEGSVGAERGVFVPQDEILVIPPVEEGGEPTEEKISLQYPQKENEVFVVYYPWKKGTEISVEDGCIHSTVAAEQFQNTIGDRNVCANGLATAVANVKAAEGKASFGLTHKLAYVAVKATSSEFAGYQLHSIQMFDKNGEAALGGDFAVEPLEGTLTVKEGTTKSSVAVYVKNHDFSATPERNELYLAVLPGDYSAADMYFCVSFVNAAGESKTVPFKFDKQCKFPAGSLTTIDLGEITSSMNAFAWYEISEKRDLLRRYAYGSQNTYMAMKPWQEPGTTVAPNKVIIDVKPRGDFSMVKEPKYYGILLSSEMGDNSLGGRKLLSIDGTTDRAAICSPKNWSGSEHAPEGQFYPVNSDYTITVHVLPTSERLMEDGSNRYDKFGRWGAVAIFDENYEVLWSYMINSYQEGDEPKAVQYPGFAMMDRFLGVGNGNEKAAREGWFDANAPAYFQWGRKDPFNFSSSNALAPIYTVTGHKERVPDIASSVKIPTTRIAGYDQWYEGPLRWDLWGGSNNTSDWYDPNAKGHKTVYDPCPEGYRIPDAKVFKEVLDKAEIWEVKNGHKMQVTDPTAEGYKIKADSPWATPIPYESNRNHSVFAYPLGSGQYDYWPFLGYLGNGAANGKYTDGRSSSTHFHAMYAWANAPTGSALAKGLARAACFEYCYFSSKIETRTDMNISYCFPVRCQKED